MSVKSVTAILHGTTYNLVLNSSTGKYEATLTAPNESSYNNNVGHYFPVTIKATDDAGNVTTINDTDSTFGENLKLKVKETVLPVIVISSPTDSEITSNAKPTVNWTVTDSGSGVNPDTIGITIDEGNKIISGITKTQITNGYQCSYSVSEALTDGTHTVCIDADDYDGNAATTRTVSFLIDTIPPELSVISPVNNLVTNSAQITLSGKTSDKTSGIDSVFYKINGGSSQNVDLDENGNFSTRIQLHAGANTIVVTAVDEGGMSSSITRIVTLDISAPVIENVSILPNPVSTGELIDISVTVTD